MFLQTANSTLKRKFASRFILCLTLVQRAASSAANVYFATLLPEVVVVANSRGIFAMICARLDYLVFVLILVDLVATLSPPKPKDAGE